mgnify:CR=1 FL=1|tara:strand:- start:153 stop:491 length:339 start_codon:yes stop_codon:yes gene_type:complete
MKRNIKSGQRSLRQLHFIVSADGTVVTGLDSLKATSSSASAGINTIVLSEAFASTDYVVQVTCATADCIVDSITATSSSVITVVTVDATDGTSDKDSIIHVTVTGSDVTDRY